jgi:hypothetical protein
MNYDVILIFNGNGGYTLFDEFNYKENKNNIYWGRTGFETKILEHTGTTRRIYENHLVYFKENKFEKFSVNTGAIHYKKEFRRIIYPESQR